MSNKSIETQLFTWEEWDETPDPGDYIFYNVELVVPLGKFEKGHKFAFCNYCPSIGIVEFFDGDKLGYSFQLQLSSVPYIPND